MHKLRVLFKKYIDPVIPLYSIFPLALCLLFNTCVYYGGIVLTQNRTKYDFTSAFDRKVPMINWFILIYWLAYIFWLVNYVLTARISKEHCMRFTFADIISRLICAVFFLLLPTTNIRPQVMGDDIFAELMRLLYRLDPPANLFPSIHCLVSWFSYIGIRGKKQIPLWYRVFSLLFALAICASTQFTKQHYWIDLVAGIALAELMFFLTKKTNIYKPYWYLMEKLNGKVWGSPTNKA